MPTGDFDAGADWHVMWIWSLRGADEIMVTAGNRTWINAKHVAGRSVSTEPKRFARTLAHELIHHLGGGHHDSKRSDLMHDGMPHGIIIRKDRLLKATRW